MTSIGIVANRLLKILTVKKFMPDTTLNTKLQTKKAERQQQKEEFTRLGGNLPAVMIIQKFLADYRTYDMPAKVVLICSTVTVAEKPSLWLITTALKWFVKDV